MCRMLVVDDSATSAKVKLLSEILGLRVHVFEAACRQTALEQLQSGDRMDVIMANIDIPDLDGFELCEQALHLQPWIKRVILTSRSDFASAKRAVNMQLNGYITKPIDVNEFISMMNECFPEAMMERDTPQNTTKQYWDDLAKRKVIADVLAIIEKEYHTDLSLDYLARRVHMSSCYLSTLFRKSMGQSLLAYLIDFRMVKAAELLANTNDRVCDISVQVGYRSVPYFCTAFKRKFLITPAQYRKLHGALLMS